MRRELRQQLIALIHDEKDCARRARPAAEEPVLRWPGRKRGKSGACPHAAVKCVVGPRLVGKGFVGLPKR